MVRYKEKECTVSIHTEFFFIFIEINLFFFEWLIKPKNKNDVLKMIVFSFLSLHIEAFLMIFLWNYISSNFDYYNFIYECLIAFVSCSGLFLLCHNKFPYWEDDNIETEK